MYFRKRRRKVKRKTDNSWKVHKQEALGLIDNIVSKISQTHKFEYNSIKVRNQRTRWGSCSSKGNLNFNYRIIHLPYELAEYLVIHELCHLKEMNHSKNYWALVAKLSPNYKALQKRLKEFPIADSYIRIRK